MQFVCLQINLFFLFRSKNKFNAEYGTALLIIALSLLPLSLWALCYSNVMSPSYISFCGDFFMDEFSF